MSVYFYSPEITGVSTDLAKDFFKECRNILEEYLDDVKYIMTEFKQKNLISKFFTKDDIIIFFNSEDGNYNADFLKQVQRFCEAECRIWPIAMTDKPKNRKPPEIAERFQSFDVYCVSENRSLHRNNMRAVALTFARKIISQTLSPLYQDKVNYFISHRRSDGEHVTAKLADELRLLTRNRSIFRDVVNIEVGNDAQKEIDKNLKYSDVVIFIQTKEACESKYIVKELSYAILHDIPILWIQIDDASYADLEIKPSDAPMLNYDSADFDNGEKIIEIAEKIEEECFRLLMNSSSQIFSYIEYLTDLAASKVITLDRIKRFPMSYELTYKEPSMDRYNFRKCHFIQCYGRNPKPEEIASFEEKIKAEEDLKKYHLFLLLSNHGDGESGNPKGKICCENFDAYLSNIEKIFGKNAKPNGKRIIISGAFPDCDEIYKQSLTEAVVIYAREVIRRGYTLVFGAHPTFQNLIFQIGQIYAPTNAKSAIEMHMSKQYIHLYDRNELEKKCTLILSDDIHDMRKRMICEAKGEVLICRGGLIKEKKENQGVDEEVGLARSVGMPVALIGTVGGRSSEYAFELLSSNRWSEMNDWGEELNEALFYNVNHRLMAKRILEKIE